MNRVPGSQLATLFTRAAAAFVAGVLATRAEPPADLVRFDFESGDLQGWRVVEGAFDQLVCARTNFHRPPDQPYNKQGKFFLATDERKDGSTDDSMTGILESPVFALAAPDLSLLVGGGSYSNTCVALCTLDGTEVLQAHGINGEVMQRIRWQAPQLVGQKVFLRVVDDRTGWWGHVTLDDFTAQGRIDAAPAPSCGGPRTPCRR
jgi:hypothetical protein